jgi:hypothetical protein
MSQTGPNRAADGATMNDMPPTPAHAKPARRDLIWVLVLIAACGLLEVWASWLQIGALAGFPKLGAMTTGWILPVTTEAYWTAALYAWLVDPAGPKSKLFAMGSGAAVFALSLAGQESDHLLAAAHEAVPPVWVVGFVTALPLIAVALVAVLIHLRQTDRDEAAEVVRESALAAELAAVRGELESALAAADPLRKALTAAQEEAAVLTRKLARISGQKPTRKSAPKKAASSTRKSTPSSTPEPQVPDDVDTQAEALRILAANPDISGSELGRQLGRTERYGCMLKKSLAASTAGPEGGES